MYGFFIIVVLETHWGLEDVYYEKQWNAVNGDFM